MYTTLAATSNYYMERKKEALEYFKESIRIAQKNNFWDMEAKSYHNAAGAMADLGDIKNAEEFLMKSLRIQSDHKMEHSHGYRLSMRVLATLYERTGRAEKAEEIYRKLIEETKQSKDTALLAGNLTFYSMLLNKQGKHQEAIAMSKEALDYFRAGNDFHGLIAALVFHTKNLEDAGRFEEALKFEKEAFIMQRKTFATDLDKQIGEMEVKYKTAEKESRIKLQEAEIDKQKTRAIFLYVLFFLIILTGVLLFNRYRLKAKQAAQEEKIKQERLRNQSIIRSQEEERSRVSRELHDGLGQMLSAARLNLASLENKNGSQPVEFKKALEMIDDSCIEVRNISHDLMPALLVRAGLISTVEELAEKTSASAKLEVFVDHDENNERLPQEVEINLFRIIQELLNNIIKYAQATEVHIQFTREENNFSLLIEDNGKGFDKNILQTSKGNGWHNIQSRLELIHGTIEIDSQRDNGTVVHIEVPLKQNSLVEINS
jgi:signal transduction histidine kinase